MPATSSGPTRSPPASTMPETAFAAVSSAGVRASEGSAPIVECLSHGPHSCRIAAPCRLKGILVSAFDALYDSLDEHTLADLVEKPRALKHALIRS